MNKKPHPEKKKKKPNNKQNFKEMLRLPKQYLFKMLTSTAHLVRRHLS